MASSQSQILGLVGIYDDPSVLTKAVENVRDQNYREFDAFTPYPVHGLEKAQGLKRSPIPWVTFIMGLTGCTAGFLLQWWTSAVDWPLIVGGKPFNSWPAFVPIMFELTILFGGISTFLAVIAFCKLPNIKQKAFDPSITRDQFVILIEAPPEKHHEFEDDPEEGFKRFNESEVESLLRSTGAKEVKKVYREGWF